MTDTPHEPDPKDPPPAKKPPRISLDKDGRIVYAEAPGRPRSRPMDIVQRVMSECSVGQEKAEEVLGILFMAIRWSITAEEHQRVWSTVPEVNDWLKKATFGGGGGRTGELRMITDPDAVTRNLAAVELDDDAITQLGAIVGETLQESVPDIMEKVASRLPLLQA